MASWLLTQVFWDISRFWKQLTQILRVGKKLWSRKMALVKPLVTFYQAIPV